MTEHVALISLPVLCAVLVIALLGARLAGIERRMAALSRMEAKLDILLKHSGVEYDPHKNVPPEVVEAVRAGKKIEAIKRYREATGVDLKEAKAFIEDVQRRGGLA